ncbi:hypothetical protein C2E25_16990 [Geothermobacter hydrogeniphilus]|uniref:Uncharacterized protein n=1 Tax=Geothermobacter hydrogeniphilus TaxID=1969733 RepID=A0A2K2H5R2_9BACT|nr:hypothetical protein [Geothermobacter hydrogeniphilus]PNU18570.1 hypothetical protein C2E25_16990 [Geothermobacter hydrogeniphilus]
MRGGILFGQTLVAAMVLCSSLLFAAPGMVSYQGVLTGAAIDGQDSTGSSQDRPLHLDADKKDWREK